MSENMHERKSNTSGALPQLTAFDIQLDTTPDKDAWGATLSNLWEEVSLLAAANIDDKTEELIELILCDEFLDESNPQDIGELSLRFRNFCSKRSLQLKTIKMGVLLAKVHLGRIDAHPEDQMRFTYAIFLIKDQVDKLNNESLRFEQHIKQEALQSGRKQGAAKNKAIAERRLAIIRSFGSDYFRQHPTHSAKNAATAMRRSLSDTVRGVALALKPRTLESKLSPIKRELYEE